jgi:hypothetical protein
MHVDPLSLLSPRDAALFRLRRWGWHAHGPHETATRAGTGVVIDAIKGPLAIHAEAATEAAAWLALVEQAHAEWLTGPAAGDATAPDCVGPERLLYRLAYGRQYDAIEAAQHDSVPRIEARALARELGIAGEGRGIELVRRGIADAIVGRPPRY